jgi:3',5'-cyclic AMP phosphodiesterase CpdA
MSVIGIIHFSDLHFGKSAANESFTPLPLLRRRNPHSFTLARGLSQVVGNVAAQMELPVDATPYLIMSGDLTATGHQEEFVVGHTFLRSQWRVRRDPPELVGFDVRPGQECRLVTVPGNHDHWDGRTLWFDPRQRPAHFRPTPWKRVWEAGDLILEVYGLDSSAGLSPGRYSFQQLGMLSRLEVSNLIDLLKQAMPLPVGKHRARALVVHHTLDGGYYDISPTALRRLAEKYKISAILTGHTHTFFTQPMTPLPGRSRTVWELRSASTLQAPEARTNPVPGFLAHQLKVENSQLVWRTWRYVWVSAWQQFVVVDSGPPGPGFVVTPADKPPTPAARFIVQP